MAQHQGSAVVLGASISGLLTARALSPHFARVTIVERDVLPDGTDLRKGVPQAAHAHGLLASGYRVIDEFFPGIMEDLEAGGATRGDVVGDFLWFQYGRWKLRHHSGLRGITVSRPFLETAVRRRVKALPNVTFLDGTDARTPSFDAAAGRVTGVTVRRRGTESDEFLAADLVVDAGGRGSQSGAWLAEWGFGQPAVVSVKIDVGYATRVFERKPGDFFNSMGGIVAGTPPGDTRYAAVLAAEGDRWVITLTGSVGDHPPADEAGWMQFAASLPSPVVHDLAASARPLSGIACYKFPANQRRLYEGMTRFPGGYLVVGDAVCSFNPLYGQGMSVAAMEAKALDECLGAGADGLAKRFYARASAIIDIPWLIATGEDLRYPQVEGTRPPGSAIVNRYLERVHAAASDDPAVCQKFFDVLNLLAAPPSLMSPGVAWRVLARRAPRGSGTPWGTMRATAPEPAS
jgi:2-polyprenyl-6-methoxyphenol hydroxylase-like FAD-dependent oxidoreductase